MSDLVVKCAECGEPILRRQNGAWPRCCDGLGYWSNLRPLPRDGWFPVTVKDGMTFYPSARWQR